MSAVYNPNGQTFATLEDQYNIRIKDALKQYKSKFHIKFQKFDYEQQIYLSPDAKTLAILILDIPIHLWDVNKDRRMKTFIGHLVKNRVNHTQTRLYPQLQYDSVAFSPDGKHLANGSLNGKIRLWNLNNGKLIRSLSDQYGFVTSLTFSTDGKLLASGSDDGSILVWNIETGKNEPFLAERMRGISCVSFSSDSKMLVGGSINGDIYLFDVEKRDTIKPFTGRIAEISHLMFSPDDSKIASIGWDGTVRTWDVETGKQIKTLAVPVSINTNDYWKEILFLDNGDLIAINSEYDFIHLWNVNTGEYVKMLMGHASHLRSLSVSAKSKTLASHSADGTILLWDLNYVFNTIH